MSALFLNRYVLNVCTNAAVSDELVRGVISELSCEGIAAQAFSSRVLATWVG